jgi:hypothetical protein
MCLAGRIQKEGRGRWQVEVGSSRHNPNQVIAIALSCHLHGENPHRRRGPGTEQGSGARRRINGRKAHQRGKKRACPSEVGVSMKLRQPPSQSHVPEGKRTSNSTMADVMSATQAGVCCEPSAKKATEVLVATSCRRKAEGRMFTS